VAHAIGRNAVGHNAIGLIETKSVVRGIEAADALVKAAAVDIIQSTSACPGKWLVLFGGDVSAVQSAAEVGRKAARESLIDSLVVANAHPSIFPALTSSAEVSIQGGALGIIETFTAAATLVAADTAAKAAAVELVEIRIAWALGGKAFVLFTGEVSAVRAALEAAALRPEQEGVLVAATVIPAPHEDVLQSLL